VLPGSPRARGFVHQWKRDQPLHARDDRRRGHRGPLRAPGAGERWPHDTGHELDVRDHPVHGGRVVLDRERMHDGDDLVHYGPSGVHVRRQTSPTTTCVGSGLVCDNGSCTAVHGGHVVLALPTSATRQRRCARRACRCAPDNGNVADGTSCGDQSRLQRRLVRVHAGALPLRGTCSDLTSDNNH